MGLFNRSRPPAFADIFKANAAEASFILRQAGLPVDVYIGEQPTPNRPATRVGIEPQSLFNPFMLTVLDGQWFVGDVQPDNAPSVPLGVKYTNDPKFVVMVILSTLLMLGSDLPEDEPATLILYEMAYLAPITKLLTYWSNDPDPFVSELASLLLEDL